ncbi:MAG: bifunctional precorrin-2 dehydrogenase/sirohydrochlorin ferrochelatase [Lachnospiraceae bacterium]|nr:bifunctional precorrin-2 dehydrogenase/sirohydrochlorin ferrochelatase [Lachnospiraceae bacterium]
MHFPMFVSLENKKCVVVGGGRIAARRVQTLSKFCEDITVISPELCPEMEILLKEQKITYCCRKYQHGDGKDSFLLVAATNDRTVNHQAGKEAKSFGAFVSVADCKEEGNFLFPGIAMDEKSGAVIGICTSGKSPSLAKKITQQCRQLIKLKFR